jgi:hypothetical protein
MTISLTKFSKDIQHSNTSVVMLSITVLAECHCAECRHAESRGGLFKKVSTVNPARAFLLIKRELSSAIQSTSKTFQRISDFPSKYVDTDNVLR